MIAWFGMTGQGVSVALRCAWDRAIGFLDGAWPPWVGNVANLFQIVTVLVAVTAWWLARGAPSRTVAPRQGWRKPNVIEPSAYRRIDADARLHSPRADRAPRPSVDRAARGSAKSGVVRRVTALFLSLRRGAYAPGQGHDTDVADWYDHRVMSTQMRARGSPEALALTYGRRRRRRDVRTPYRITTTNYDLLVRTAVEQPALALELVDHDGPSIGQKQARSDQTKLLDLFALLLPASEQKRFVAEELGNLGGLHWWQRVEHLVGLAIGIAGLVWIMRHENRLGRA